MSSFRPSAAWRRHLRHPTLSDAQRRWLCDEGSLTARIRARSDSFAVRVLRQELLRPCTDEHAALVADRRIARKPLPALPRRVIMEGNP